MPEKPTFNPYLSPETTRDYAMQRLQQFIHVGQQIAEVEEQLPKHKEKITINTQDSATGKANFVLVVTEDVVRKWRKIRTNMYLDYLRINKATKETAENILRRDKTNGVG